MNLLNALHLLGYGGPPAPIATIRRHRRLLGFIDAGMPKGAEPDSPRPQRAQRVVE